MTTEKFLTYPATQIADFFVVRGIEDSRPVTQMQLQKMVYFANGLHLADTSYPLINEEFEAWRFGPVVPAIYHKYKLYGDSKIVDTRNIMILGNKLASFDNLTAKASEILEATWDTLKDISGVQLSNWTHANNSAWSIVWKDGVKGIKIPDDLIINDFKKFILEDEGK